MLASRGQGRRRRLSPGRRRRPSREDRGDRKPCASGGAEGCRASIMRRLPAMRPFISWSSAAARARNSSRKRCRRRSAGSTDALRQRLKVTQQARPEDREGVIAATRSWRSPLRYLPSHRHGRSDRFGAARLSAAGRVHRFGNLGHADARRSWCRIPMLSTTTQAANARHSPRKGGARDAQLELSAERLAGLLADAMSNPDALAQMAAGARQTGKPDAARIACLAGRGYCQAARQSRSSRNTLMKMPKTIGLVHFIVSAASA